MGKHATSTTALKIKIVKIHIPRSGKMLQLIAGNIRLSMARLWLVCINHSCVFQALQLYNFAERDKNNTLGRC